MIVTRFAPSPTGLLHAGNYRTAVFAYLYARHHGGKFILRIEDTDRERSKKEYQDNIMESLAWLGIAPDDVYIQSEHVARHQTLIQSLIDSGAAYISQESPEPGKRSEVIRFKNPNTVIEFTDLVRGTISMDTTDLGDFIIARSLSEPVFHFAVVVDDWDEGVTHVIRGEDHISNTPRQILIQRALGAPTPAYAHLPLVLAPDKTKLSKRKGAKAMTEYRQLGYVPEALFNYMVMVGWNPGTEQEIFSLPELIGAFDLAQVQKGGAIFDEVKLLWMNREHMLRLSVEEFWNRARSFVSDNLFDFAGRSKSEARLSEVLRERSSTFGDIHAAEVAGEYAFFHSAPSVLAESLLWKAETSDDTKRRLDAVLGLLEAVPDSDWNQEAVKTAVWPYAETEGRGQVLWPLRVSLSGREKSPDPFTIAGIIGKDETLGRIRRGLALFA